MKKLPFETKQTLSNEADFYLSKVRNLDKEIIGFCKNTRRESSILVAYNLSGIYSCFEDIFEKIAKVFENNIENKAAWHSELLLRMHIPIKGIRPAVISDDSFKLLDELRAFRHVFRQSYVFSLEADRINLLVKKWNKGKRSLMSEITDFLK